MTLDIKKCFKAALLPAIIVTVIEIFIQGGGYFVPALGRIFILFGSALIADLVGYAWAGYRAVKNEGLDIVGGCLSGIIAGLSVGFVGGMIWMVLDTLLEEGGFGTAGILELAIIAIVIPAIGIVIGIIEGAIFGAIGAFIATRMAKK